MAPKNNVQEKEESLIVRAAKRIGQFNENTPDGDVIKSTYQMTLASVNPDYAAESTRIANALQFLGGIAASRADTFKEEIAAMLTKVSDELAEQGYTVSPAVNDVISRASPEKFVPAA